VGVAAARTSRASTARRRLTGQPSRHVCRLRLAQLTLTAGKEGADTQRRLLHSPSCGCEPQGHTSCVTEHAKYALGATKPGGAGGGGAGKQQAGPAGLEFLATQPPWVCRCCSVTCTSRETLEGHAAGQKHVRRSKAASAPPPAVVAAPSPAAEAAVEHVKRKRDEEGGENGQVVKWKKLCRAAMGGKAVQSLTALKRAAVAAARHKLGEALAGCSDAELEAQCEARVRESSRFVVSADGGVTLSGGADDGGDE
jgi:hypothetical protein